VLSSVKRTLILFASLPLHRSEAPKKISPSILDQCQNGCVVVTAVVKLTRADAIAAAARQQ
jgi:hypothetical protein